ncbi:hypothetical protein GGH99_003534 [Coemansia sp. RSA 1285]|nr:hypothetical protein GGH99_003534 [Coemansia sp. RSA 1285]
MDKLREDWNELKRAALMSPEHLRTLAFSGSVRGLPLRSLQWRMYLDLLPIASFGQGEDDDECRRVWGPATEKERRNYEALRQTYVVDPTAATEPAAAGGAADWRRLHPLSLDEDSPWTQYHRDQELRTTIAQDVGRTFPDQAYFRAPRVRRVMGDILFVYARMHSALRYRQGMHELLGPLLMLVDGDSVDIGGGADPWFLGSVVARRFVEHDAFALFDRLMRLCAPWYQTPGGADGHRVRAAEARAPIVAQCYGLLEKLATVDPRLAAHLRGLDIEPQLFGIRWYRLLFSREFARLDDVVVLWGMLFADPAGGGGGAALRLADWVGVVLLLANRRRLLLAGDCADALGTLLHLPPLPSPAQDSLDRTPALPGAPAPPNSQPQDAPADALAPAPRLPFAGVTQPGVLPVQRLALQAAYLRSHPSAAAARLVASQYEVWEDDAWDVIDATEAPRRQEQQQRSGLADGGGGATHSHEDPPSPPRARASPISRTSNAMMMAGGGTSLVASAPVAVSWQGRKMYTSSILQHRRTSGSASVGGSTPSSPLLAARKKKAGSVGSSGWQAVSSPVPASASASPPTHIPLESRRMSVLDLRAVLRDLDRVYIALSNLKQ